MEGTPVGFLYCELDRRDFTKAQYWFGCNICRPSYDRWCEAHPGGNYEIWTVYAEQLYPFGEKCSFCMSRDLQPGNGLMQYPIFRSIPPDSIRNNEIIKIYDMNDIEV